MRRALSSVKRSGASFRPAAGRRAEDAGPDTDADDGQSAIEIVPGQAQFRAEAWNQITADDAFGAGAEQN